MSPKKFPSRTMNPAAMMMSRWPASRLAKSRTERLTRRRICDSTSMPKMIGWIARGASGTSVLRYPRTPCALTPS